MNGRSKKAEVRFDATLELPKVVEQIEKILVGLRAGTVHLQRGNEQLTLKPEGGAAYLGIEAKQTADKESLTVKLKWRRASSTPATRPEPLEILSKEPSPKPEAATVTKTTTVKKKASKATPGSVAKNVR